MNTKGFTLVETMVAIFLLSLAITTFLVASTRGIKSAADSLDQTTAHMLAQEGIELVRNVRDSNFLTGGVNGWLDGLQNCSQGCVIQPAPLVASSVSACTTLNVGSCSQLYLSSNNFYTYTGSLGQASKFRRIVTINQTPEGATVISRVVWGTGLNTRQVMLTGVLTDWYNQV